VSSSVTGDPKKSANTFIQYINDTGGIRGRTLKLDIVDDGGEYCPEKHKSAEIQLVEQDKVFMDLAGLHEVSELLAKDHIPFLGGESSVVAQRKQGWGQFAIYQDAEGDFQNWASFGRYYLNSAANTPCLAHPDTADFNSLEPILVGKLKSYGLKFKDILRYTDSVQNAAGQAETAAVRMKTDGCKQVWLLANNAIAAVFITAAASQQNWFPTWTWTSRTAAIDADNVAGLMNQREWQNSVGLSIRVPAGKSPYQGNCAKIYEKYNPGDNEQNSASTQIACAQILTAAEAMRRAVDVTGVLTADSLMLGVNAIHNDFYFDSTVPMRFSVPDTAHTPVFNGFWMQTVAKWDSSKKAYQFPEFPSYWQTMGPAQAGRINILPYFRLKYSPPKH
jgi:ABC-type branched-subunit amino acid transport system substrate-binding protein